MKKIFLIIFFFALVFQKPVFAQTITLPMPTNTATPSSVLTTVNYELPYPGILPGAPLYGLKLLRDKVSELLMSDPLKKSNFYLLQADKRLAAAILLNKNGDTKLSEETLSKGLNYLDKSYNKMLEAKKSREDVLDIYSKLKTSSAKQVEEIERLEKEIKGEDAQKLKEDYQRAQEIQNKVNAFNPRK